MKQKIIVTALPNGVTTRGLPAKLVSAAISLQVQEVNSTLAAVTDMLKWAELISNATFTVLIDDVPVQANQVRVVTRPKIDIQLWKNLFAPGVRVVGFVQEDLSKLKIFSYPAKHIINYIAEITKEIGTKFSDKMPDSDFFTGNKKFTDISMYDLVIPGDKEQITLNTLVKEKDGMKKINALLGSSNFIPFKQVPEPELDFTQLRAFHGVYKNKEQTFQPPPEPDFEFHDILSILSSYPPVMRKLGLVVDLEISNEFGALKVGRPDEGTIRIIPNGIKFTSSTTIVCPPTSFVRTSKGFYTNADKDSLINKGHVKIATDAFTIFQMDVDGSALKVAQQMDSLLLNNAKKTVDIRTGNLSELQMSLFNNKPPRKEGLPAQRNAGIAIALNGLSGNLSRKFNRMNELGNKQSKTSLALPAGISSEMASYVLSNEALSADDINLGYRMDVFSASKGEWQSLHYRKNTYSFLPKGSETPTSITDLDDDEGFIQLSAAQDGEGGNAPLKVGEVIARWEGWSLSVRKPGMSLNDPTINKDELEKSAKDEEKKYKKPITKDFALEVLPGIKPGSLPMLRFGNSYKLKLRTVDIAGNSVPFGTEPENSKDCLVQKVYKRYEPVSAPFLIMGNAVKDGESIEQVVIRSNENFTCAEFESSHGNLKPEAIRHVKPPRCTVQLAEQHKMLDAAFNAKDPNAAQNMYLLLKKKDPMFRHEFGSSLSKPQVVTGPVTVEYLADPMAAGVTFFISELDPNPKVANPDSLTIRVSFYDDNTVDDSNSNKAFNFTQWMQPRPFKIKLVDAKMPSIVWDSSTRTLVVSLQQGVMLKLNYSCFWREDDIINNSVILETLGLDNLKSALGIKIARGQHWMFSPWREITFVHAVQQPVQAPVIAGILPVRNYGDTATGLAIKLFVHSQSTEKIDIESKWKEKADQLDEDGPKDMLVQSKVFQFTTVYAVPEYQFGDFNVKNNPFLPVQQQFGDTKHRMVDYKVIGVSRYREYFTELAKKAELNNVRFPSTKSSEEVLQVNIPSSARPLAPEVAYVIPTFNWTLTDSSSMVITSGLPQRKIRTSFLRVYLKRPWYSSGDGEQLGVVFFPDNNIPENMVNLYTTIGADPTKQSKTGNIGVNESNFKSTIIDKGLVMAEQQLFKANVAPYDVHYDPTRGLYYADIMIDPAATVYTPFIRLALARYQKNSLRINNTDCCLSPIVLADYVQLPATRISGLTFTGGRNNIIVELAGIISESNLGHEIDIYVDDIMVPVLNDAFIDITAFKAIASRNFIVNGKQKNVMELKTETIPLPPEYGTKEFMVRIFEYELLNADPLRYPPIPSHLEVARLEDATFQNYKRLVYADAYEVK